MWLKPFKNRYERERGSEASTSCPKFRKFVAERLLEMSERLGLVTSVIDLKFNDVGTYKFVVSDYETVILKEE
ncbi:MAG: hypothetical protein KDH96_06905 [Candidatus Riesia sp.]|nr:hypothetical protein [Candidatus Riesia sp.]